MWCLLVNLGLLPYGHICLVPKRTFDSPQFREAKAETYEKSSCTARVQRMNLRGL
jgi:hypothetical protein